MYTLKQWFLLDNPILLIIVPSFFFIVPSPVRNLTQSFNGTHITFVTWEAPEFPRGEVNYTVVIQERDLLTDDTSVVAMYVIVELQLMVDYPVEAYFEYTINVTSQTSAGEGDTETIMFQTPEEGKAQPKLKSQHLCLLRSAQHQNLCLF